MDINYPDASGVTTEDGFHITGWAVSQQNIDKINVYVDGNFDGSAYYGAPTGSLASYYPTYPNSDKAGYDYYIEPLKYSVGDHTVRVEAVGKDGSKAFQDRKVVIQRSRPAMDINWPNDGYKVTGDGVHITGWAVNKAGIKEINVYANGNFVGKAYYGAPTGGLTGVYGTYANSANAGYDYFVYANNYPEGMNKFTLEAVGNDSKIIRKDFTLYIVKENPAMDINYPNIDENIKDDFRITGWAVNKSGVKQINVYDNGNYAGQANYGSPTGGLANTFPSYPNVKNAGYDYYVDLSKYSSGEHVFLVEAVGNNGTKSSQTRKVIINKPAPAMDINTPSNGDTLTDGIYVRGWSVAKEGVRDVKVYLNNTYVGQANYGEPTSALANYYSGYKNAANGGYSYFIETKAYPNGNYQ
ncbi:Ig-like domain-containing protein, partial [Clostridium folliculivorans]|uniref:Ig-like domain-containing protein n=1 Tax=Clostridium folliculivorans TaxID=2886038 RepID=UPI0021C364BB